MVWKLKGQPFQTTKQAVMRLDRFSYLVLVIFLGAQLSAKSAFPAIAVTIFLLIVPGIASLVNFISRYLRPRMSRPLTLNLHRRNAHSQPLAVAKRNEVEIGNGARHLAEKPLADTTWGCFLKDHGLDGSEIGKMLLNDLLRPADIFLENEFRSGPKVSVIMPTFNRTHQLTKAIQSVIDQSYPTWELIICDDGSEDDTSIVVQKYLGAKIKYLELPHRGAAAARNTALSMADGEIITYLDSDNIWHPDYLAHVIHSLNEHPGRSSVYTAYVDIQLGESGQAKKVVTKSVPFSHEALIKKPFIDLNTFAHRREMYEIFGGFDEGLNRRQDYDLILKYTWLRDPIHLPVPLCLYIRDPGLFQITQVFREDVSAVERIDEKIRDYFQNGLPVSPLPGISTVTIISWDSSRNHFSKAFNLASALSDIYKVKLVSFEFFEDEVFEPYRYTPPTFELVIIKGDNFPSFLHIMKKALKEIDGDAIYAVKPHLTSLGLALLAVAHRRRPVILEINDLELEVQKPQRGKTRAADFIRRSASSDIKRLAQPWSSGWLEIMEDYAIEFPSITTHNQNIDERYGRKATFLQNIKSPAIYSLKNRDRNVLRREFGVGRNETVLLFGGMVRAHKGLAQVFAAANEISESGRAIRVLVVSSRQTPDLTKLMQVAPDFVSFLGPQDEKRMADLNLLADFVVLWLNGGHAFR